MAFVKLDCGMLDSTLWIDRESREVFITALLMAEPREFSEAMAQLAVRSLDEVGYQVPPGWYGFVPAAGIGIVRRAMVDLEPGLAALERLGAPDKESRSKEHDGRRLVRIDGGYVVLNFMRYREKDHTGAERARRYRERKQASTVTSHRDRITSHRDITHAEAEAEAEKKEIPRARAPKGGRGISSEEEKRRAQIRRNIIDYPQYRDAPSTIAMLSNAAPLNEVKEELQRFLLEQTSQPFVAALTRQKKI